MYICIHMYICTYVYTYTYMYISIDWCCFYYSNRVALLEALFALIFFQICVLSDRLFESVIHNAGRRTVFWGRKTKENPGFVKRRKFPSFDGVIQVISPNGGNSFVLEETKGNPEIKVGALLFMFIFQQELFKCFRETLVDWRLEWGIYESTPRYK